MFCAVVSAFSHCFLSSSCMIWFCWFSFRFSWLSMPLSMPMCPILRCMFCSPTVVSRWLVNVMISTSDSGLLVPMIS